MDRTNYATKFMFFPNIPHEDFTCLFCGETWIVQKVLGPDNVWRRLPAWCRKCDGVYEIPSPKSEVET